MNWRVSLRSTRPTWICSQKRLAAFGVVAAGALVAAFEADQCRLAAFRALPEPRARPHATLARMRGRVRLGAGRDRQGDDFAFERGIGSALRRHKADLDHVLLDDIA